MFNPYHAKGMGMGMGMDMDMGMGMYVCMRVCVYVKQLEVI
jgi:hypothetical protein